MASRFPLQECVYVGLGLGAVAGTYLATPAQILSAVQPQAFLLSLVWLARTLWWLDSSLRQYRRWWHAPAWPLQASELPLALLPAAWPVSFKRWWLTRYPSKRMLVGRGFRWTAKHTQELVLAALEAGSLPTASDIRGGHPAIHAVGAEGQGPVAIDHSELVAQTSAQGANRSGKTFLLKAMAAQAIARPHCATIIEDPKGSRDFLAHCAQEARRHGRPFKLFTPAFPESSCTMNMLDSAGSALEVAMRIRALMPTGKEDFFREFPLALVENIASAQRAVGIPWTLKHLYRACIYRKPLADLLYKYLDHLGCFRPGGKVEDLIAEYEAQGLEDMTADALIDDYRWPVEHRRKIIATMIPAFRGLIGPPLGDLLSPATPDITWKKIVEENMVVYFAMASMIIGDTANRLGRLLLQDLIGFLGHRYAYTNPKDFTPIMVLLDEVGDVIYPDAVDAINKGGEANAAFVLAYQSLADLESKIGREQAQRLRDNTNNRFFFRLSDGATAEDAFKEQTCDIVIPKRGLSLGYMGWSGLSGHSQLRQEPQSSPLVLPSWLTSLPRGEAFLRTKGEIWKIEVPMLPPVSEQALRELGLTAIWNRLDPDILEWLLTDETPALAPAA